MLGNQKYIVKNKPLPVAQDMEVLKAEGIELSKQLSGDIWTDYNEHDPGVTVLENLCYAMMEMSYKANFDFEQLFFAKDNTDSKINLKDYFLLRQEEVLYNNPITPLDYRKLLLDHLDEDAIKNIWVDGNKDTPGIYTIYMPTGEIQAFYERYRNFGEQCHDIIVLNHHLIQDDISVDDKQIKRLSAEAVIEAIAQFIQDIKTYIEPPIRYAKSIEKLELQEEKLRQLHQGPLPTKKFIHPDDLETTSLEKMKEEMDIAAFIGRNADKWNNLIALANKDALKTPRFREQEKRILIFDEENFIRKLPKRLQPKIRAAYKKKSIEPLLNGRVEWDTYAPKSQLLKKDLADYYSVQYTFPQNYNLGLKDISMLDDSQQKQIRNLQDYLSLFESLCIDFLVKLISFPELLKINRQPSGERTEAETQFLELLKKIPSSLIKKKEGLLKKEEERIKDIYKNYSFNQSQQIKLREYALARYGEIFDTDLIKKAWGEPDDFEGQWLQRLNQLMESYKSYSQGRHNSFNLNKPNSDFPLSQKLSILLNHEYDTSEPNVYIVESSLIASEENPFKVAVIINLGEDLTESTPKDKIPAEEPEPVIKKELLSKRQGAIIELIKEELPFHLTYGNFFFLTEHIKGKTITKIEELLTKRAEKNVHYLNKTQFIEVYRAWRESLANNTNSRVASSSPEN